MNILLQLLAAAAAIWGYFGINFDAGYDPAMPSGALAYAVPGSFNNCYVRFNAGFEFIERSPEAAQSLIHIAVHEVGHCIGLPHAEHYPQWVWNLAGLDPAVACHSVMYGLLGECVPQVVTIADRLYVLDIRRERLGRAPGFSSAILAGLAADGR